MSYTSNKKQKYPRGCRVRIAKNLGPSMSHFEAGRDATVLYTYASKYGYGDFKAYGLDVDGIGEVAWYKEKQLTRIEDL